MTSPPHSYADAAEARAYVARVLRRSARRKPGSPPRVYIVAPSGWYQEPGYERTLKVARAKFPGAELADYWAVFPSGVFPVTERVERIAAECDGALVLARRFSEGNRVLHLTGYGCYAEARELVARGVPVFVLSPGGIVTWADVKASRSGVETVPHFLPIEIDMPEAPPSPPLPTVAASYRAIGMDPPPPRKPRKRPTAKPQERKDDDGTP